MSPKSKTQFEEIRHEKKELIIKTALELFANNGYHSTSINQITKKAKISKGLIYNYFKSKEDLLIEILKIGFQEMLLSFNSNSNGILEKHELKNFIEKNFDLLEKNPEFWKFYFSVSMQPSVFPLLKEMIEQVTEPLIKMTVEYFKSQGFEDPETEALLFGAMMDGLSIDYVYYPKIFSIEKVKNAIIKKYCS